MWRYWLLDSVGVVLGLLLFEDVLELKADNIMEFQVTPESRF